ncbi:sulfotransferase family protein [Sulfurimonas sp. ST-25]|uniref:sulfotransferase family protein n=1 Tax=Sulfurimonas sp. ST-25 TaxID=3400151 RepID=UPI003A83FB77
MSQVLPNFLIVGAGKSGSTSLYHYINQHPEVYMPDNKEPNFLVSDYQRKTNTMCPSYLDDTRRMIYDIDSYQKLFNGVVNKKMIGEATVTYLYQYEEAISKIKKYLGADVKILIILRDPVERTFSNYAYACELGYEALSFREALDLEEERLRNNWSSIFAYRGQSHYLNQVQAYLKAFDNVHIVLTHELKKDPKHTMEKVFAFLGLENIPLDFNEVFNPSGIPRFQFISKFLNQNNPFKSFLATILSGVIPRRKLRDWARTARHLNIKGKLKNNDDLLTEELYKEYYSEVCELEKVINKDLSAWKR